MGNQYFGPFDEYDSEAELYRDWTDELIEMNGIPAVYLPQSQRKLDYLYGEDILAQYLVQYDITLYMENVNDWEGQGDLYTKFSFVQTDEATFWIEKNRFTSYTGMTQPLVGDLIYLPHTVDKVLLQISHANPEKQFYHLGNFVSWRIGCRKIQYSHEDININTEDPYSPYLDVTKETDDFFNDIGEIDDEFEDIKGSDIDSDPFNELN